MVVDGQAPAWYEGRTDSAAWAAIQPAGDTTARHVRSEMVSETGALLDLITKATDWTLADCEAGSTLVVRLADLMTRARAAIARERTLQ